MKRLGLHGLVIASVLSLTATATVLSAAQGSDSQDLQTRKQMEEFVAKASTPADHTALSKHFLDMAAKYKADADTHTAMAARYRRNPGNPNRPTGGDPGAHCDHVAHQAREAAATATELAKLHERMAAEAPKTSSTAPVTHPSLPMAEPRFPDLLPAKQAEELVAAAKTPADHTKLAKHFVAESAKFTSDANRHAAMAAGYRANSRGTLASAASHCDHLVQQTREAAKAARDLATYHEGLAANTSK